MLRYYNIILILYIIEYTKYDHKGWLTKSYCKILLSIDISIDLVVTHCYRYNSNSVNKSKTGKNLFTETKKP